MKRKAVSGIVLTLVLMGTLIFILDVVPVSAVESPYIEVTPESTVNPTLSPGMNYTVSIHTDCNQKDITAYQFNVSYNPSVLRGVEVVNGDLIVGGSAQFINGTFNNIEGSLSLTAGFYFSEGEVTSGPGILANVTFTVVDYGASVITIGDITRLYGWDDWFWVEYYIIDAATMPTHIQHGYFCNLAEPVVHDIIVSTVTPRPTVVERGEPVNVHVVVGNQGTQTETFDVKAYYNYDPGFPDANIINTKTISNLASGASISLDFEWNTIDVTEENYTITAVASSVDDETDIEDNTLQSDEMVQVNTPACIYIMADGRVNPPEAPVSSVDNITYTLTGDIYKPIVVEKDNIVVDGLGYIVQESISLTGRSNVTIKNMDMHPGCIYLRHSSNITISGNNITNPSGYGIASEDSPYLTIIGNNITNIRSGISLLRSEKSSISGNNVTADIYGIDIQDSSHTSVSGNTITGNAFGIRLIGFEGVGNIVTYNNIVRGGLGLELFWVSNSTIHGNNIPTEVGMSITNAQNSRISENNIISSLLGIVLSVSDYNIITGNTITGQKDNSFLSPKGIYLSLSSKNSITKNTITGNEFGITLGSGSSNNSFFHNNLIDNLYHVNKWNPDYANFWDSGCEGNYWSDYEERYPDAQELNGSGIWDTPYVIDENNQDNYPLMEPWNLEPPSPVEATQELIETIETWNLPEGTENSLKAKLKVAIHMLDMEKEDGAIHNLSAFINRVEMLREETLTNEQADYLISEAQRIMDLING